MFGQLSYLSEPKNCTIYESKQFFHCRGPYYLEMLKNNITMSVVHKSISTNHRYIDSQNVIIIFFSEEILKMRKKQISLAQGRFFSVT